jgi:mRNA-degrading endonuclease RelE of RelBE toxin-antitoxin system
VKAFFTQKFLRQYHAAPQIRQRQFDKQLAFLLQDLRHPSLRAKVYDKSRRIWQARVNGGWRFYFQIRKDTIYLLTLGPHPK